MLKVKYQQENYIFDPLYGKVNKNQNKYSWNVENEQGREDINYTRMDAVSFAGRKIVNKLRGTTVGRVHSSMQTGRPEPIG